MAKNGHSVCGWDEWESLDGTQREREVYRILKVLDIRTQEIEHTIKLYAFAGGVVGGAVAVVSVISVKFMVGM